MMKSNVEMVRGLEDFIILQRTKDKMFNATKFLEAYNKKNGFTGRKGKRIDDFLKLSSTKEFLDAINEDILNTDNPRYSKPYTSTRGKNGGTWMSPYLFIDFAMWLNPRFKLQVIKFVYDQLIEYRHEAGDNYILLSASGTKLKGYNYAEVATAMNWIIFNKRGKNLRQTATQAELQELSSLEKKLSFAIDMGYIKTYNQLIQEMRKIYAQRNNKF